MSSTLVPALKAGDVVIIDNLGSHKERPGDALSAPPAPSCSSSPPTAVTSIPIEQVFAKLKSLLASDSPVLHIKVSFG
jgi:hypothetical protein